MRLLGLFSFLGIFSHAMSQPSVSLSIFGDENAFLQINLPDNSEKWAVLIYGHVKMVFNVHENSRQGIFRVSVGKLISNPERDFCIILTKTGFIDCGVVQKREGRLGHKPFPSDFVLPYVTELSRDTDGDIFTFSADTLIESQAFTKKISKFHFPSTSSKLREANILMKANQNVKIYVSLTTSPSRLKMLHYTLDSLDSTLIDRIFVTIPHRFKNKYSYNIPVALLSKYPKLKLLKIEKDFGPILKLTGAAQYVSETLNDPNAETSIFITIDDDQYYSMRTLDTLIYYSLMNPESVITAASHNYYNKNTFAWPTVETPRSKDLPGKFVYDCEGFAGVAYRGYHIDFPLMLFFADKDRDPDLSPCHLSDDLVITTVLQLNAHPIYGLHPISSPLFYSRFERFDLPTFIDSHALHRLNADGTLSDDSHTHKKKYDECLTRIQEYYLNRRLQIKDLPSW